MYSFSIGCILLKALIIAHCSCLSTTSNSKYRTVKSIYIKHYSCYTNCKTTFIWSLTQLVNIICYWLLFTNCSTFPISELIVASASLLETQSMASWHATQYGLLLQCVVHNHVIKVLLNLLKYCLVGWVTSDLVLSLFS